MEWAGDHRDDDYGYDRLKIETIGNESVLKIIINDTVNLFFKCNPLFGNFKP